MIEISGVLYIFDNKIQIYFKFIKYDNFIKIFFQYRTIIILFKNLKNYKLLFQFYILSLLKEQTNLIIKNKVIIYSILLIDNNDKNYNIKFNIKMLNNLINSKIPSRETSIKKQKKFLKLINYYNLINPLILIEKVLFIDINKIIDYENKIYLLCCIRSFNRDIYYNIKKFL